MGKLCKCIQETPVGCGSAFVHSFRGFAYRLSLLYLSDVPSEFFGAMCPCTSISERGRALNIINLL